MYQVCILFKYLDNHEVDWLKQEKGWGVGVTYGTLQPYDLVTISKGECRLWNTMCACVGIIFVDLAGANSFPKFELIYLLEDLHRLRWYSGIKIGLRYPKPHWYYVTEYRIVYGTRVMYD